jgi:hypothetical protein
LRREHDFYSYASFAELRITFPSADQVEKFTVFNIAGNKYRLIVAIHYNRKKVYIHHVLTHAEYSRDHWRKWPCLPPSSAKPTPHIGGFVDSFRSASCDPRRNIERPWPF